METYKLINHYTHKTSFDILLPPDPKSKSNKFITKGYSLSVCILNIMIKIGLSIGILFLLLSQMNPKEVINDISKKVSNGNRNVSTD